MDKTISNMQNPWVYNNTKKPLIGYFWRMLQNQLKVLKTGQQRERHQAFISPFLSEMYLRVNKNE